MRTNPGQSTKSQPNPTPRLPTLLIACAISAAVIASGGRAAPANHRRAASPKAPAKKTAVAKKKGKKKRAPKQRMDSLVVTQARASTTLEASSTASNAASLGTAAPTVRQTLDPIHQSTATVKSPAPAAKRAGTAGADLTVTYSDSVRAREDADRESTMDLELAPWLALGKSYKLDAYLDLARSLNGYQESKLAEARLGLSRNPLALSRTFKHRPKLTVFLPVDPDRREIHSYLGGVGLTERLLFATGALSGYYQIGATKNFYSYTTTGTGESNPSHSLSNVLVANLALGKAYLQLTPGVTSSWTYEGAASTAFQIGEEIGYAADAWTIGIGHTNSDSLYKASGAETNFTFYNGNTSKYYVTAGITI